MMSIGSEAAILGTGTQPGERRRLSVEIEADLGLSTGTLEASCGVIQRPVIGRGQTQESMGARAATIALDDAGLQLRDLDMILFASAVGRQPIPATAALIKRELGLNDRAIPAFDINATCLSAINALDIAKLYVDAGRARHVLIVSSEIPTRALDWEGDPATAALFGDGAAALVVGPSMGMGKGLRIEAALMETWSEGYDYCSLAAGGTRYDYHADRGAFEANTHFQMDGHALFKLVRKRLPDFVERLLALNGWTTGDIDLVIPHQASPMALEHMIRRCGFRRNAVINTVRETGNLVATSIPMTLDHARRTGRVESGMKLLLVGTAAGVSIGGATLSA